MIIKSSMVSDYEGFKSLTSYDEVFTSRPDWVEVNEVGTYIKKFNDSYKLYHCVQDSDKKFVWHKLHSITVSPDNKLLMDISTLMSLDSIKEDLTDKQLKDSISNYLNSYNKLVS